MGSTSSNSSNLDLLRAIAVLTVMIDHLIPTLTYHGFSVPDALAQFTANIGQAGVLAFFVHTSLVLMYSLERLESHPSAGSLTRRFYNRRLFRIYPLAVTCVVLVVALGLPAITWGAAPPPTARVIVANLLLVQNLVTGKSVLGPLWSLPYEVQMYVVLPALYFLARRQRGALLLSTLFAICCAGGFALAHVTHGRMNMAAYLPCFLCGVLCYALRDRIPRRLPGSLWPVLVLGMVTVYCAVQIGRLPIYWVGWIFCLVLGLAINAFRDGRWVWLNRVSEEIATYSYGLYLLHVLILNVVFNRWQPRSLTLAIIGYFVLSAAASVMAYRLVEAPMMKIGRRLSD